MNHPLAFVSPESRKRIFLMLLALTLILLSLLRVLDRPLHTDAAPNGIVSFELAGDPRTAHAVTDSWKQMSLLLSAVMGQPDPNIVNVPYVLAAFGLGLDYLFMPVYALTLSFGSLLAHADTKVSSKPSAWWQVTRRLPHRSSMRSKIMVCYVSC